MRTTVIMLLGLGLFGPAGAESLLEGRVRLPSGAPVPGAQVLLFDLADLRAAPRAASTDRSGNFTLPLARDRALPQGFELGAELSQSVQSLDDHTLSTSPRRQTRDTILLALGP